MKVTIIGGSGFIGTRIVDHFTQFKGYDFRIVDIRDSHFFNDITTIGDVRDQQQMDSALAGTDLVILLAAQHRDNVTPTSLYYDTNVGGMRTTLRAMERNGVKRILFFSSVAVYGINKDNPDETSPKDPFNHYGKSKWQAEQLLQEWHTMHADWNINVVRPTVTFGERNRGNVYNLLHQIQSRHFLMVGNGRNRKSMAYVGNIVAFVCHRQLHIGLQRVQLHRQARLRHEPTCATRGDSVAETLAGNSHPLRHRNGWRLLPRRAGMAAAPQIRHQRRPRQEILRHHRIRRHTHATDRFQTAIHARRWTCTDS